MINKKFPLQRSPDTKINAVLQAKQERYLLKKQKEKIEEES